MWNQNVLATFCFLLSNGDPKAVGYLTAAMGVSQLLVSFPTGVLADRYRRDGLLKVASFVGILAIATTFKVLFFSSHKQPTYGGLIVALCMWGCFWGIASTCLTALFADSVPNGQRSKYFTHRSILINLGNVTGPIVALIMFVVLGDEWNIRDCSIVMAAGQLICLPAVLLLCWLKDNDENCNEDDENSLTTSLLDQSESPSGSPNMLSDAANDNRNDTATAELQEPHRDETYNATKLVSMFPCCCSNNQERIIPSMVATADCMAGLASGEFLRILFVLLPNLVLYSDSLFFFFIAVGMSIRYFAIFLYDNLKIKPVHVQILYMIAPLLQASLAKVAQALAKKHGRCYIAVVFKWIGISLMLAMVGMSKVKASSIANNGALVKAAICTLLVLRTAFMNSTSALTKSVLMDHVPKDERAKWSALESFNMFSWSGSAALGGILVDSDGILFTFCITAALQFVATFPHLLLATSAVQHEDHQATRRISSQQQEDMEREEGPEV
jgi:MFS family permease